MCSLAWGNLRVARLLGLREKSVELCGRHHGKATGVCEPWRRIRFGSPHEDLYCADGLDGTLGSSTRRRVHFVYVHHVGGIVEML